MQGLQITFINKLVNQQILLRETQPYKKLRYLKTHSLRRSLSKRKQSIRAQNYKQCPICLENLELSEFDKSCQCEHRPFCSTCTLDLLKVKIMERTLITCEVNGCDARFNRRSDLFEKLDDPLKNIHDQTCRLLVLKDIMCRMPDCNGFFTQGTLQCDCCMTMYCHMCQQPVHEGHCLLNNLIENSDVQKCPNCHILIVRDQGCNHIVCPCKFEFCYVCGGKWSKLHHLCSIQRTFITNFAFGVAGTIAVITTGTLAALLALP